MIADSCYSCFDYPNALADLVIGYMGVPWQNVNMTEHQQVVTVRTPPLLQLQPPPVLGGFAAFPGPPARY